MRMINFEILKFGEPIKLSQTENLVKYILKMAACHDSTQFY